MSRCAGLLVVMSLGAWAEGSRPTVVLAPLEVAPVDPLPKEKRALATMLSGLLEEKSGALFPSKAETEAFVKEMREGGRSDYWEADEALAKLAEKSSSLYALVAKVYLSSEVIDKKAQKALRIEARVVRKDGRLMRTSVVKMPKGKDTVQGLFRVLALRLIDDLTLRDLATFIEVPPPVETPPVAAVVEPGMGTGTGTGIGPGTGSGGGLLPPPLPPPEVRQEVGSTYKTVGWVAAGVGVAAVIAGAVTFASAPKLQLDSNQNVVRGDVSKISSVRTQQGAGVGLIIGGAVVALAGGGLVLFGPGHGGGSGSGSGGGGTVRAAFMPTADGAAIVVGGTFR